MISSLVAAGCLLASAPAALAEDSKLPLGVDWCDSKSNVEFSMETPQEMAGDVLESTATVWGMSGFVSAVFEEGQLVTLRVRFFESPDTIARARRSLEKVYGAGGESGKKVHWSPGGGQKIQMRVQSEQVYVSYEIPPESCSDGVRKEEGLTDQEKADLDSVARKQAVEWDPYADADDEEPIVKKKEEEKTEEEEKKEEEEEETKVKDADIDW